MPLLATFSQLESLVLTNCQITDSGARMLVSLPKLKYLSVSYCWNVTESGVEYLRNAMPNLKSVTATGNTGTQVKSELDHATVGM